MRTMVAALAVGVLAAGLASAQYKTPAPAPAANPSPVAVSGASPVQITPAPPTADPLAEAKRIPRAEAIKMVKEGKAVWIDVRSKEQYEIGHIPGAINIPLGDLTTHFKELPVHKYLIAYCA